MDTIAAVSTAMSESGIGIIRISGPDAIAAADLVFRSPGGKKSLKEVPSHTIHYGSVADSEGQVIDEVLVSVMRAPRTYTAEDTVEINCHGGILAMRKVLDCVLHCDRYKKTVPENLKHEVRNTVHVRAAQPGEFTKRAFLNGRIDLSRAEAVMDLIEAKNDFALKNSVSQVRGALHEKISSLRSEILYQIAHIEASLDDPENLDFVPHISELQHACREWKEQIRKMILSFDDGRLAAEGIRTVIVGKPNAGKSSLMNLLMGEERAIVTDVAGTTRDILTETIQLQGITLLITDTAGIRDTSDKVEKIGVGKAEKCARQADLLLWIIDSSVALDENDERISRILKGRKAIILLNKSDLKTVTGPGEIRSLLEKHDYSPDEGWGTESPVISFSAKEQTGFDELVSVLKDLFFHGKLSWNDEVIITNERHRRLLEESLTSVESVIKSIEEGMSEDFFTIDLMSAYESLGRIIGQDVGEDLVNEIFSRFCMGK